MRILLVEDEEGLNSALVEIFKKNRISVDSVLNGADGLKYAQNENYDVIVLDIMLPGIDGLTILRTLRENKNNVPVILLTAKDEISAKVKGLDAGADDYLTKPFSTDELLARIRAISRRKGEFKTDSITFNDVTLHRTNCELQNSNNQAIKLSLKEFQILDLLFENPHQVITKGQLIEKIWGTDSNAEYNNVEVYISFLRNKFESLNVCARIRTTRGIGYSLEDDTRK